MSASDSPTVDGRRPDESALHSAGRDKDTVIIATSRDTPTSTTSHDGTTGAMESAPEELRYLEPSPLDESGHDTRPDQDAGDMPRLDTERSHSPMSKTSGSQSESRASPPPMQSTNSYVDPTPKTPQPSQPPAPSGPDETEKEVSSIVGDGDSRADAGGRTDSSNDDQSEIQSIMEQFSDETKGPKETDIMSPRMELAENFRRSSKQFAHRRSSLEYRENGESVSAQSERKQKHHPGASLSQSSQQPTHQDARAPSASSSSALPPPEPEQPFDFHRFLEQLRHRTADPVAKFLRSFLHEFGKRQWLVHEQVKIISDFLAFITNKMAQCEVWRNVSDAEFDNAKEGMEKLVMNRLYNQTFSPLIPPPPPIPRNASRSKRLEIERQHGSGRRGQHQEDVERDEILAQKIRIYSWVREEHLDIPPLGNQGRRFLQLAQQELLKIKGYRAPRDKVICILNCCKVIIGLLKHSKNPDTSADSFMPLLIYVVLKANPENLVSNVQYILRFRNQEKLGGETGYYLSSLSGAIHFIENLDRTSLTVSDEEFERNVEAAVSAIAQENQRAEAESSSQQTPRHSSDIDRQSPAPRREDRGSAEGDNAPVTGLLRTIQKPLSTIGRIFTDEPESPAFRRQADSTAPPVSYRQPSPAGRQSSRESPDRRHRTVPQSVYDAQEAAARQASAEAAEARRIQRAEHQDVVETLSSMFPNLDKEVIDDVVRMKEGRVGLAVDACLALSAES